MNQGALFPEPALPRGEPIEFDLPDADLTLHPCLVDPERAAALFERLSRGTPWEEKTLVMYGREVREPRLTAWYGDPKASYVYSGLAHEPLPWTDELTELRRAVEEKALHTFNSVLLNYYRDGRDSVSWHADDEPELGPRPVIASLSLGATRDFQMKHAERRDLERVDIALPSGSLLVMAGDCQLRWRHQVPKRRPFESIGGRINLTFRQVLAR